MSSSPGAIEFSKEVMATPVAREMDGTGTELGALPTACPMAKSAVTALRTASTAGSEVVITPSSRLYDSDEVEKFSLPMKTVPARFEQSAQITLAWM